VNLWRRLVACLAHREPATPLALFRIATGLVILVTFADMLLTDTLAAVWYPIAHGGIVDTQDSHWLIEALGGTDPSVINGLVATVLVSAVLMVVGLGSRIAALVALQGCLALFSLHPGTGGGHDRLIVNGLWLLVLAPSDATLSLWSRIRSGSWVSTKPAPVWVRYLIIYQIVLVYTCTGVQKLGSDWWPWGDLRAVYYSLLTPSWQRWESIAWVADLYPLTQAGTALTLFWEMSWGLVLLALWYRATRDRSGALRALFNRLDVRRLYALIGVGVHVGIWAMMNLGPFSWITLTYYLCLWHHDEYARLWRRIRR
jgi:hypothetical protein